MARKVERSRPFQERTGSPSTSHRWAAAQARTAPGPPSSSQLSCFPRVAWSDVGSNSFSSDDQGRWGFGSLQFSFVGAVFRTPQKLLVGGAVRFTADSLPEVRAVPSGMRSPCAGAPRPLEDGSTGPILRSISASRNTPRSFDHRKVARAKPNTARSEVVCHC